ncbi:MAG: prolipoprotein diacylglyceryl transferase [Clostridiales bacterium]|nr:prolipoprotein diacylglyceryl transferase [Clostridiales bacterium]
MYPHAVITIFGQGIYLYGICMALGLITCFVFLMKAFQKQNFNDNSIDVILLVGIFGVVLGLFSAMLFQSIYDFIANPEAGFKLGGMTFLGGLIGGVVGYLAVYWLYIYVIAPRTKIKWLQNNMNAGITDALPIIPVGIVLAHAFGRLGCFFAGCCHGAQTDAWYGIDFPSIAGTAKYIPTQLFECIFLLLLAFIMIVLFYKYKFNCNFGVYCIGYGIWRFLIEYIRDDYRGELVPGLTPSQFWCILMVALGIGYFFLYKYLFKDKMKHPELQPSVYKKATANGASQEKVEEVISQEVQVNSQEMEVTNQEVEGE